MKKVLLILIAGYINISAQWEYIQLPSVTSPLKKIHFLTDSIGYISTWNSVLKTTDGGMYWNLQSQIGEIDDVFFLNADTGFAVGSVDGNFYYTYNGAVSWQAVYINSNYRFHRVYFINDSTGFITGENWSEIYQIFRPMVLATTNGGSTWSLKYSTNTEEGYCELIEFYSDTGIITGYEYEPANSKFALKTTDGGSNWVKTYSLPSGWIDRVFMINENAVYTGGNGIYKSTDFGTSWIQLSALLINSLYFINDITGFAVSGDCIYKTTNSGNSWVINYPENREYKDITFINADTGFTIGAYQNTLLRTTNCGIVSNVLESKVGPSDFALLQNYPNPFNPTTSITFNIGNLSLVTLNVYDILGNKVKTLVDGVKHAGSYTVRFKGNNLASGIYYYRLNAGGYTATRKLILLK